MIRLMTANLSVCAQIGKCSVASIPLGTTLMFNYKENISQNHIGIARLVVEKHSQATWPNFFQATGQTSQIIRQFDDTSRTRRG